jgi:hypothetical protein
VKSCIWPTILTVGLVMTSIECLYVAFIHFHCVTPDSVPLLKTVLLTWVALSFVGCVVSWNKKED